MKFWDALQNPSKGFSHFLLLVRGALFSGCTYLPPEFHFLFRNCQRGQRCLLESSRTAHGTIVALQSSVRCLGSELMDNLETCLCEKLLFLLLVWVPGFCRLRRLFPKRCFRWWIPRLSNTWWKRPPQRGCPTF